LRSLGLVLLLMLMGCGRCDLHVRQIAQPDYPLPARFDNIQGTVEVQVTILADGKVTFAKGSGAHPILIEAAEQNARQWMFGPFPKVSRFPLYHTIKYEYKLEGVPVGVGSPPTVTTHLPDRVEVVAGRLMGDRINILAK
jgi:TonB family protein